MAHQEKMSIRPRLNSKISKIFFVYSISETNSLILPVHLPLCSIYMFRALLPLKWSCSWEFCFLLQSSHVTQLSNPVGRTELRNLISFIWQICGKGKFRIWQHLSALGKQLVCKVGSSLPHLLFTSQILQCVKHPASVLDEDFLKAAFKQKHTTLWACHQIQECCPLWRVFWGL